MIQREEGQRKRKRPSSTNEGWDLEMISKMGKSRPDLRTVKLSPVLKSQRTPSQRMKTRM